MADKYSSDGLGLSHEIIKREKGGVFGLTAN